MSGSVALRCTARDGAARLTHVRYDGLARVSRTQRDDGAARVVLAHLGPGIIGGDRYAFSADVDAGATLVVRGQMATPVFARERASAVSARWQVAEGGLLVVHPEPLMLDAGARHDALADAQLARGGRAILGELVTVASGARLRLRTTVRIDGRLVVRDACDLATQPGAVATVILAGGDAAWRTACRAEAVALLASGADDLHGGVGGTGDAVLVRVRAPQVWPLARALDRLISRSRSACVPAS